MNRLLIILPLVAVLIGLYGIFSPKPEIRNALPVGEQLVAFGDSLTYGTGAPKGEDYPSQLAKLMDEAIINKGVPGDTTARALQRLDDVLALKPRIVFLTLGGNDLKNGISKTQAFANLEQIVIRLQAAGALVVIGGIDLPLFGKGFDEAYEVLAIKTSALLVPNVFEDIMGDKRLMSDQIHPNGAGYTIMAEHFYQAVKPYLN